MALSDDVKRLFDAGHTEAELVEEVKRRARRDRLDEHLAPLAFGTATPAINVVVNDWTKLDAFFDSPERIGKRERELVILAMRAARRNRNAGQLTQMALLALKSLSLS